MTEIEAMPEGWEIVRLGAQSVAIQTEKILPHIYQTRMTRIGRRDMKVASQIAEYATPSIWGNPTVTCVGSNAGV